MADLTFADAFTADFFATWGRSWLTVPTIARGGGCALRRWLQANDDITAMLIAADTAKFRTARDKAGRAAGHGRLRRLTRAIGKAKAMDLI